MLQNWSIFVQFKIYSMTHLSVLCHNIIQIQWKLINFVILWICCTLHILSPFICLCIQRNGNTNLFRFFWKTKLSVSFRVDKERGKVMIFSLSFLPWRDSLEINGQRFGWRKLSAVVLKTGCEQIHVFLSLTPGKYRKLGQSNGSIFLLT